MESIPAKKPLEARPFYLPCFTAVYATLDQRLVDHRVLQLFSYLERVWYTHTLFIFHLTQESILLGCVCLVDSQ